MVVKYVLAPPTSKAYVDERNFILVALYNLNQVKYNKLLALSTRDSCFNTRYFLPKTSLIQNLVMYCEWTYETI